jgi:hypothetical protein
MAQAIIIDDVKVKARRINETDFGIAKIVGPTRVVRINDILPFRVRFTTIGVEGYGQNNVPGIGIQVIGFSNYIL